MTTNDIENLAGNALDAEVARRVFGLAVLGEATVCYEDGVETVVGEEDDTGYERRPVYQDGVDLWAEDLGEPWNRPLFGRSRHCLKPVPRYSTDPAAAWRVAEWLRERWGQFALDAGLSWHCYAPGPASRWGTGDTMMEAVCRAALLEVGRE